MIQSTPIDIILADDHEIYRDGFGILISKIPEINLIGEASNGHELIRTAHELHPDVIITDIKMPEMDGIEATKRLKKELPDTGIIALSMYEEDHLIIEMLEAGANGYLLKNAQKEEIVAAVKAVNRNESYFCRNTSHKLAQMIAKSNYNPYKKNEKPSLTEKEIMVIKLICQELSNKEIADQLNIGRRTVETHRKNIIEKLDVKNTVGIVVYAMKNNIC